MAHHPQQVVSSLAQHRSTGSTRSPAGAQPGGLQCMGAEVREGRPWRRELQGSLPDALFLSLRARNVAAGSWSQGGFALAAPLLQRSTASGSAVASSHLSVELGAGHGARIPEDGSDTCFSPRKVLAHEAETAGAIMTFFLSLGLALGAAVSFLFRILI